MHLNLLTVIPIGFLSGIALTAWTLTYSLRSVRAKTRTQHQTVLNVQEADS